MTKNINLTIISKRYEADTEAMAQPPADVRPQELKIVTEAVMESAPGRVEIIYDESELSGLQGNSTHLIFNPDDPDIFTMQRTGPASSWIIVTSSDSLLLRHNGYFLFLARLFI